MTLGINFWFSRLLFKIFLWRFLITKSNLFSPLICWNVTKIWTLYKTSVLLRYLWMLSSLFTYHFIEVNRQSSGAGQSFHQKLFPVRILGLNTLGRYQGLTLRRTPPHRMYLNNTTFGVFPQSVYRALLASSPLTLIVITNKGEDGVSHYAQNLQGFLTLRVYPKIRCHNLVINVKPICLIIKPYNICRNCKLPKEETIHEQEQVILSIFQHWQIVFF